MSEKWASINFPFVNFPSTSIVLEQQKTDFRILEEPSYIKTAVCVTEF